MPPISQLMLTILGCAIVLNGCNPPAPSAAKSSGLLTGRFGELSIDTRVEYGSYSNGVVSFIIWTDLTLSEESSGRSGDEGYYGTLTSSAGHAIKWECTAEPQPVSTGTMTINDTEYQLAKGALFLVTIHDGSTVVKQLGRDMTDISGDRESFDKLAEDSVVNSFFQQDAEPKESTSKSIAPRNIKSPRVDDQ